MTDVVNPHRGILKRNNFKFDRKNQERLRDDGVAVNTKLFYVGFPTGEAIYCDNIYELVGHLVMSKVIYYL